MGWGPLGPRAATVRPTHDPDTYGGGETWFKNCTAPGAADGTVPTASWFNFIIAQFKYAGTQAGVTVANDQSSGPPDEHLWTIIQNAITARLGTAAAGTMQSMQIY
jgi:hypothetical protein